MDILTEKEKRIRKRWLICFLVNAIYVSFFLLMQLIFKSIVLVDVIGLVKSFYFVIICETNFLSIGFLVSYIIYHCAYKKKGVILLTILLILYAIFYGIYFPSLLMGKISFFLTQNHLINGLRIVGFLWGMYLCWLHLRLLRVNKNYHFRLLQASEEAKECLSVMQLSWDPNALFAIYGEKVRNHPKLERILRKKYYERKTILENFEKKVPEAIEQIKEELVKEISKTENHEDLHGSFQWVLSHEPKWGSLFSKKE